MQPTVFLEYWGKPLLILHALLAILLLGSMTHNVLLTVPYLWGRYRKVKLEKLYVRVITVSYLLTFTLGSLIYPNYRYYVRELYFDKQVHWASNLFDIKEHWAAVGLALVVAFWLLSRHFDPREQRDQPQYRSQLGAYVFLSVTLALIVWFNVISGLLLTAVRGV